MLTDKQIFLPYLDGTLYMDISPVKQAQALIRRLVENHNVYVVTANILGIQGDTLPSFFWEGCNARATQYMLQFLWDFYPEIPKENIIITPQKHIVKGDILIDDNPAFLRTGSYKRILLDKPYNRDFDDAYFRVWRAKDWAEVEKYIEEGVF